MNIFVLKILNYNLNLIYYNILNLSCIFKIINLNYIINKNEDINIFTNIVFNYCYCIM